MACQHRLWVIGRHDRAFRSDQALLWCYVCGALRRESWRRWIKPTGDPKNNPHDLVRLKP